MVEPSPLALPHKRAATHRPAARNSRRFTPVICDSIFRNGVLIPHAVRALDLNASILAARDKRLPIGREADRTNGAGRDAERALELERRQIE